MKIETGYYSANGKVFASKFLAILEAQQTGVEVEWHFFEDVFGKIDWSVEPDGDLDEMYRKRALQIREAYDYLIIRCSGGADSTNVIWTFLNNGIHVDEIIADAPWSGIGNWKFNTIDTSVHNYASEFEYAQKPLLREIAAKHPNIKILMRDAVDDIFKLKADQWLIDSQDSLNPWTDLLARFDEIPHVRNLAEAGKRIAIVSGVDKPVLFQNAEGIVHNIFTDLPTMAPRPPFRKDYPNADRILFYWTHEDPGLIVKMAHVTARAIHRPENRWLHQAMLDIPKDYHNRKSTVGMTPEQIQEMIIQKNRADYVPKKSTHYNPFSVYERGIVPFIYPKTYVPNLFQADKIDPSISFFTDQHEWFRVLHKDLRPTQLMESAFRDLYKMILPKYMNPRRTGLKRLMKFYPIGHTNSFKPKG